MLAAFAGTVGLVNLVASTPQSLGRLARALAIFLFGQPLTRPQALILGLLLFAVAHGLAGRRRLAVPVALGGLALVVLATLPQPPQRVALLGGLALALVALRAEFTTQPDPHRLRLAAQVGLAVVAIVLVASLWDLAVGRERPRAVGESVLDGLTADPAVHSAQGGLLAFLIATGAVTVLLLAFAPGMPPEPGDATARRAVATLAAHDDSGSLAPFATRADKAYIFSPDGRAAIGYQVRYGVALAGGDPVGAADSAPAAIEAFLRECTVRGWRPAVLGAAAETLPGWGRYGLQGLPIGDEAVLDVATFSLASRRMRNVRQAVQRTRNAGVRVWLGRLDGDLAEQLRPVLDDWLGGHSERGFAMNLDHILTPRPDCLLAIAYGPDGQPEAFARFARCGAGQILTLDVAPRRSDAINGVVERLVVEAVTYAREHGVREVSLNFAGLRQVFDARGPFARLARPVTHVFDVWIPLRPLCQFCAKFRPRWRTRYLLVRSWLDLGAVVSAAVSAEFGAARPAGEPAVEPGWLVPEAEVNQECAEVAWPAIPADGPRPAPEPRPGR